VKPKLVLIEWIDSHSSDRWEPLWKYEERCDPLHCRTVGWVVAQRKGMVLVVSSLAGERNGDLVVNGCGEMAIPKRCVVKMKVLKE
jgi:hypothetical protein